LAEATVNKRTGNAKVFFGLAVKRKLIVENPFQELEPKSIANKSRQYFLERKDAEKILAACPDAQWRLIFALCRYGGLRCPSEVLALQWSDVNWQQRRILIHSPKTERHEGRESRIIPIFPEILPHLQDVFDVAKPGTRWVITRYRRANQNFRTTFEKIISRAGLKTWPRLFQNLRASRETELASQYPLHIATAWIGNTARVAERHYLQVPDEFYQQAIRSPEGTEQVAQKAAQYHAVLGGKERKATMPDGLENAVFPLLAAKCN
jgi:integrase